MFPEPIGAAASWNPELFRREGEIIGIEGRAKFNDYASRHNGDSKWWAGLTYWTPNINIFRDPRWGRGQETFGEDPFLTSEIGIEFVKGIQGDDPTYLRAMACAKHYAVHSGPERTRHFVQRAEISERDLFDTYLPQFERVVREGKVAGVMSAYNSVNGVPATANAFLLTELVRKRWGFEGYIVSDCDAVRDIYGAKQHHFVQSAEEAAAFAIKAGCNLCCGGDYNALVRAVQQGLVSEPEIDTALYHTLWTRFRLGLFDPAGLVPYSKYTLKGQRSPGARPGRLGNRAAVDRAAEKRRHPAARSREGEADRGHRAQRRFEIDAGGKLSRLVLAPGLHSRRHPSPRRHGHQGQPFALGSPG